MAILNFQKPDKVIMIDSTESHGKFEFRQKFELKLFATDWPTPIITMFSYPSNLNSS